MLQYFHFCSTFNLTSSKYLLKAYFLPNMSQLAKTLRCTYYLKQVLRKKCQWALGGPSMFDDAVVDV